MTKLAVAILHTINYFDFFSYSPTIREIYKFLPQKESLINLKKEIVQLERRGRLKRLRFSSETTRFYLKNTLGEYSIKKYFLRKNWAEIKKEKGRRYWCLLSFFSQINMVGISGSVTMNQAGEDDDLDLFIITAPRRLWTGRMIAIFLVWLMGLKRRRGVKKASGKICLNLFFDGKNLTVPKIKQTQYVAHEILQMKPVIDKKNAYRRFLMANSWITSFFPNVQLGPIKIRSDLKYIGPCFGANWCEKILKKVQLFFINRHRTTERITDTQLWFFPDDFEKKMKR